jgi:hypothetical protein
MIKSLLLSFALIPTAFSFAQNTFPSSGNVGIGTTSPSSLLHLFNPSSSTYLSIDKPNSGVEGGIVLSKAGAALFYIWSDNADDDALKIEATGLSGEQDATPRMTFPRTNKNIYMAQSGGSVGIGTTSVNDANYKLFVETGIRTRKVKVDVATWPDYVFSSSYKLPSLKEVEQFIKQHKHLPDVPSEAEVKKEGLDLGENQVVLLKKIEELTLYIIEQNKKNEDQNKRIEHLEKRLSGSSKN